MMHPFNNMNNEKALSELGTNLRKILDNNIFEYLLQVVQFYLELDADYYYNKSRLPQIVKARHLVMYFTKKHTKMSFNEIGFKFSKDHSTIIHGVNRIKNGIKFEKGIKDDVENIDKLIKTKVSDGLGEVNIDEEYYHIDLNNIYSIKMNTEKSIILKGFNDFEFNEFIQKLKDIKEFKEHINTGIYILEKRENNGINEKK